jgi:hypothetical protein
VERDLVRVPDVVDEAFDRACLGQETRRLLRLGEIRGDPDCGPRLLFRALDAIFVPPGHDHAGALGGEHAGGFEADARR